MSYVCLLCLYLSSEPICRPCIYIYIYIYMHPEQVWIYDESRLYSKSLSITASDILLNTLLM